MKIVVSLNLPDYLYGFYQKCAESMEKPPQELMEQVLYLYAGKIAEDMRQNKENPEEQ